MKRQTAVSDDDDGKNYMPTYNKSLTIDLNGHSIDGSNLQTYSSSLFSVSEGKKIVITDGSTEKTGVIRNISEGIAYAEGGPLELRDITITGCSAQYLIYNNFTTLISGCTITGNEGTALLNYEEKTAVVIDSEITENYGKPEQYEKVATGGILNRGTLYLGGDTVITGNFAETTVSNVALLDIYDATPAEIIIGANQEPIANCTVPAPTEKFSVGVRRIERYVDGYGPSAPMCYRSINGIVAGSSTEADVNYFSIDDPARDLQFNTEENRIELVDAAAHRHVFTFTASKNVLQAACTNTVAGCDIEKPLTLTLTYDDVAVGFLEGEVEAWKAMKLTVPAIQYYARENQTTALDGAPTAFGKYVAKIVSDRSSSAVTAALNYEIRDFSQAPRDGEGYSIDYANSRVIVKTGFEISKTADPFDPEGLTENAVVFTYGDTFYIRRCDEFTGGTPSAAAAFTVWEPDIHEDGKIFATPWDGGDNNNALPTVSGSYYLTEDIDLTNVCILEGTEDLPVAIDLCLNGKVVRQTTNTQSVLVINNYATLNLYDCGTDTHYFTVQEGSKPWLISETETSKAVTGGVITGGSIRENYSDDGAGGIDVEGGVLNMYGGTVCGNDGKEAGGVYVGKNGVFTMYGGAVCGNSSINYGGVTVGDAARFTMEGGKISENCKTTYDSGCGVYVKGSFIMNDGEISKNYGSGVRLGPNGSFGMHGGEISENTGRGVMVDTEVYTVIRIYGGRITGHHLSSGDGAGIYISNGHSDFAMFGGEISGNSSDSNYSSGAGIYSFSKLTFGGTAVVKDNTIGSGEKARSGNVYARADVYSYGVEDDETDAALKPQTGMDVRFDLISSGFYLNLNTRSELKYYHTDLSDCYLILDTETTETRAQFGRPEYPSRFFEVKEAEHGYVDTDPLQYQRIGKNVTFTDHPDSGYVLKGIKVNDGVNEPYYLDAFTDRNTTNFVYTIPNDDSTAIITFTPEFEPITAVTSYYGLWEAITNAKPSAQSSVTVKLAGDVKGGTYTPTIRVPSGKIILDLDGHVINKNDMIVTEDPIISCGIATGIDFEIKDSNTGMLSHKLVKTVNGWELNDAASSDYVTISGGVITGARLKTGKNVLPNAPVWWEQGSKLTISGGSIAGNSGMVGGLAYFSDSDVQLLGGSICYNTGTEIGGVGASGGTLYIGKNASIDHNSATGRNAVGGGLCVDGADVKLDGGSISYNSSSADGGGVYVGCGSFDLLSGSIDHNSAERFGGGVYVTKYVDTEDEEYNVDGLFTMKGGVISDNTAVTGGGVFVKDSKFVMSGGTLTGNTAMYYSGAIYNDMGGTVELTAAAQKEISITANKASLYGGVYNVGDMTLSGKLTVKGNTGTSEKDYSYATNLATIVPLKIGGALTGSEIHAAVVNSNESCCTGKLCEDYAEFNPSASADTFFCYDGPDEMILKLTEGDLEVIREFEAERIYEIDLGSVPLGRGWDGLTLSSDKVKKTLGKIGGEDYELYDFSVTPALGEEESFTDGQEYSFTMLLKSNSGYIFAFKNDEAKEHRNYAGNIWLNGSALDSAAMRVGDLTHPEEADVLNWDMPLTSCNLLEIKGTFTAEAVELTPWGELQNAIDATPGTASEPAAESTTIKLEQDYTAGPDDDALIIPAGKSVCIDLNGHILDRGLIDSDGDYDSDNISGVFEVYGSLQIMDSDPENEHSGYLNNSGWHLGEGDGEYYPVEGGLITGGTQGRSSVPVYSLRPNGANLQAVKVADSDNPERSLL